MEVGLSTLFYMGHPFSHLLRLLRKVEVGRIELVDEGLHTINAGRVRAVRRIVQERDLKVTVHAPFADVNISSFIPSIRRVMLRRLKRSLLHASQIGSHLWVFHPGLQTGVSHIYPGTDWELNLRSVRELLDAARRCNVEITIENMPSLFPVLLKNVGEVTRFYRDLGETDLGLTLDVGHANINGQIYEFIERLPERIAHVHVHDNDGTFDSHLGIGYGNINWSRVIQMLKKMNYRGTLIVESEKDVEESLQTLRRLLQKESQ